MTNDTCREPDVLKGALAGLLAGIAAAWVMNNYEKILTRRVAAHNGHGGRPSESEELPSTSRAETHSSHESDNPEEAATVKIATALSTRLLHRDLSDDEKKVAGPVVHYAMGGLSGALYGAFSEVVGVRSGLGTAYGLSVWFAGDETALPLLNLSRSPLDYSVRSHLSGLTSRVLYGITTEVGRRFLRATVLR